MDEADKSSSPTPSSVGASSQNQVQPFTEYSTGLASSKNTSIEAPSAKRLKSEVWEHFAKIKVDGEDKAQCNYCRNKLSAKPKHGTSHLREHYNRCTRKKMVDIRQQVLMNSLGGKMQTTQSFDNDLGRIRLAEIVAMHEYPLSMVDHIGFKRFVHTIQPMFHCPTRNTLKNDSMGLYNKEKDKMVDLLELCDSRVAITIDMWTTSNQKRGFMAITTHFVDDNWHLQDVILRFIYVPGPHTSDALADIIVNALMEWNLDTRLSTITVDNCSTNDSMIEKIKGKFNAQCLFNDGSIFHMRCCAHILNLIVKMGLEVIRDGIEKARDSVVYWTASPKRREI